MKQLPNKFKATILVVFIFLLNTSLSAQCYKSNLNVGKQQYNSGKYQAALATFQKSLKCPDAKGGSEAKEMIEKCKEKLNDKKTEAPKINNKEKVNNEQTEKELREKIEKELRVKIEQEMREKIEKERIDKLEQEKRNKAEQDRRDKIEKEKKEKIEQEKRDKAEQVNRDKTEKERKEKEKIKIGKEYGGGFIFYIDNTGEHGLICAPYDQGEYEWGCYGEYLNRTSFSTGRGKSNTNIINNNCKNLTAAQICADLFLNGYDDWYLPSIDELVLIYNNIYAKGIAKFQLDSYWSSSEYNDLGAYTIKFDKTKVKAKAKNSKAYVRAIRSF